MDGLGVAHNLGNPLRISCMRPKDSVAELLLVVTCNALGEVSRPIVEPPDFTVMAPKSAKEGAPSENHDLAPHRDGKVPSLAVPANIGLVEKRGLTSLRKHERACDRADTVASDESIGRHLTLVFETGADPRSLLLPEFDEPVTEFHFDACFVCSGEQDAMKICSPNDDQRAPLALPGVAGIN